MKKEKQNRKKYWKNGLIIGVIVGLVKIPFFVIFGRILPDFIGSLFYKIPDETLCYLLNILEGEPCGFFVLIYGFIYNPIFYGLIGIIIGSICGLFKENEISTNTLNFIGKTKK